MNSTQIKLDTVGEVVRNTDSFMDCVPKAERKKYGQFFTPVSTAAFMAEMFDVDLSKKKLNILDAGAGTGILSTMLVERIFSLGFKGNIILTCYETDPRVLPVLEKNMEYLKSSFGIIYDIRNENYITSQIFEENSLFQNDGEKYDYVIGNPPYKKISKDAPEAVTMGKVCHGMPNLYFLFWAMGVYNLRPGGELVYIIPRSWTSGAYFKKFREYLLSRCIIADIHLFESRDKVFGNETVLQETMIVKVKKTAERPSFINLTTSNSYDFDDIRSFKANYCTVVSENQIIYLITNRKDEKVLERVNRLSMTLADMHLKMQTGLIVDFRTKEVLRDELEDGAFPLLFSQHIKDGRVSWPLGRRGEVIKTDRASFLQENSDLLLVKRFTSKEEKRRLQCGIYLKRKYSQFSHISTQNKVNFIKCDSPCITYGLFVLLNSSLYDTYYRIMNGSTQVNSTEINQMPVPERRIIEEMGRELMHKELTESNCDKIIDRWIS